MNLQICKQSSLYRRVLVAAILCVAFQVFGGRPLWPPPPHSAAYRQANLLFLQFQNALAAQSWDEALAFCSERVRAQAGQWPTPAAFFKDTVPLENLLAQDFGFWTTHSNFYGLLVPLTAPGSKPVLQWYWAICFTNNHWEVDYPPARLEDYVAGKKAALQAREDKIKQVRQKLEPRLRALKTHLTPLSERWVIGSPMLFRVELINFGDAPVLYQNAGVGYHPLTLLNEAGQVVPAREEPNQIMVRHGELAPGSSVILADRVDLRRNYDLSQAGKYFVQFNGTGLDIGEEFPPQTPGPFGENEGLWPLSFVSVLTKLPSELVQIEVFDRPKR